MHALKPFCKSAIMSTVNNLEFAGAKMDLKELIGKAEFWGTYQIYKHCMYMPTEEKFSKKTDLFLNDNAIKIFACYCHKEIKGIRVFYTTQCRTNLTVRLKYQK